MSLSELVKGVTTRWSLLQMMTAVEKTGGGVSLSELVTGVTTRRSFLQMMTAVEKTGGGVSLSELVTGVTTRRSLLQMMTAVEETGGCVPVSELVTGLTTRRCCQWVSPHTPHALAHPHTVRVSWGTPLQHCSSWGSQATSSLGVPKVKARFFSWQFCT